MMDKFAEYLGIQPPQIVLLTPDEAREAGLDVSALDVAPEGFKVCHDDHTGKQIACPPGSVTLDDTEETTESGTAPVDVIIPDVEDTVAPTLALPSDMEIQSDNDRGAKVQWTVSATDNVDTEVEVICDPSSGKIFPIGETDVLCVATDKAGNSSYGSFTVTVLSQTNEGKAFPILPP